MLRTVVSIGSSCRYHYPYHFRTNPVLFDIVPCWLQINLSICASASHLNSPVLPSCICSCLHCRDFHLDIQPCLKRSMKKIKLIIFPTLNQSMSILDQFSKLSRHFPTLEMRILEVTCFSSFSMSVLSVSPRFIVFFSMWLLN